MAGWLLSNYRFFGDWSFLAEGPWSAGMILIPALMVSYVFLRSVIGSLISSRTQRATPMAMRVHCGGMHLSGTTFDSWFTRGAITNWILEEDLVGWKLKETGEELRIPVSCFSSHDELSELQTAIRRQSAFEIQSNSLETGENDATQ